MKQIDMEILDNIRRPEKSSSLKQQIIYSLIFLAFGAVLGLISKVLDTTGVNELPYILQRIDIVNFLGRLGIWIFIAVCISVYSSSAFRAAVNVFLFFVGVLTAYYLYSAFGAGFFPRSYALIWVTITVVSPLMAFICWYAKGKGWIAAVISGVILGVLFAQAVFLFQGVRIANYPELVLWFAALWILRREPKEFAAELAVCLITALLYQTFMPYWG
ncbi:MAG: hypothetical protein IJM62_01380 [Lachnospiraceae bacterium]|nr:hypothetical protein [Lachnospiraceae bacterium]